MNVGDCYSNIKKVKLKKIMWFQVLQNKERNFFYYSMICGFSYLQKKKKPALTFLILAVAKLFIYIKNIVLKKHDFLT